MPPDIRFLRAASAAVVSLALAGCLTTPAARPSDTAAAAATPSTGGVRSEAVLRFERPSFEGMRWFKGNTHTHTLESDGDSPPEVVARWYKSHGYQFLVLSDHNVFVDPKTLAALVDSTFLLIPGEELTTSFQQRPVHVNGLNLPHVVPPRTDSTLVGTIQRNVDAVREVGGVPHINHPNFRWAFGARELKQIERDRLLEIFNGHPHVHNEGGGDAPGMEAVWDELLTAGKRIYGIAVDDAHSFTDFSPERSNPGRGWIVVRARALDAVSLLESLEDGLFYASTGVAVDDVAITDTTLAVHIRQDRDFRYRTRFIGAGGRILLETSANPAVYTLRGGEAYVRAKVIDSGGRVAWVQPVFTRN